MTAFKEQPCIGLFGTCGATTFRQDLFIPAYEKRGITYFNPQVEVEAWVPEFALTEADHLMHDVVQCWPILDATYATGSMAEQGFSIAQSLRSSSPLPKFIITMISMELHESLTDLSARKESLRARHIVATNLTKGNYPNVFEVSSLEEMLETSIILFDIAQKLVGLIRSHNPAYKRFMKSHQDAEFLEALKAGYLGKAAQKIAKKQAL